MRSVTGQFALELLQAGMGSQARGVEPSAIAAKARELLDMNYPHDDIVKAVSELKD